MSSTLTFRFAKFHPQTMAQLSSGMPYAACPTKCFVHFALELDSVYLFLVRFIHDGLLFRLNLLCCFCRSFRGCFPFRPERLALVVIRFLLGARGSRTSVIASSTYLKTADDFHRPRSWID